MSLGPISTTETSLTFTTEDGVLTPHHYSARITAVDTAGNSSTEAIIDDITPPSAPSNLVLTPGNGEFTATWDPNSEDDLFGYVYAVSPDWASVETTETSVTITGLENGIEYTFNLWANDCQRNQSTLASDTVVLVTDFVASSLAQYPLYFWALDETSGTTAFDTGVFV